MIKNKILLLDKMVEKFRKYTFGSAGEDALATDVIFNYKFFLTYNMQDEEYWALISYVETQFNGTNMTKEEQEKEYLLLQKYGWLAKELVCECGDTLYFNKSHEVKCKCGNTLVWEEESQEEETRVYTLLEFESEIKENGYKGYCPMILKTSECLNETQVNKFCKNGCSVECPKWMLIFLKTREKG